MSPNSNTHPGQPHHTSNDTIGNLALDCIPAQHQAQATIDDSQGQDNATPPDMGDCPCGTLVILLIHVMMNEASDGLKGQSPDNDDANDGMTITSRELDFISLRG